MGVRTAHHAHTSDEVTRMDFQYEQSQIDAIKQRLVRDKRFQISIDGQLWTIDASRGGCTFSNDHGRVEAFRNAGDLLDYIQSNYENPEIAVL
jgi:hypothetical protein